MSEGIEGMTKKQMEGTWTISSNLFLKCSWQDMVVLYDSLQLAHKCILNSFYGYVMRK
jgi:DNA polymerase epsilon subunit 1